MAIKEWACFSLAASISLPIAALAGDDTWMPVGFNDKRIAVSWVQARSYEPLNEYSFRLKAKGVNERGDQIVGRIDVNCKNKDFYFRPNGTWSQQSPWAAIAKGSAMEAVATYFCRRTAARGEWGYTQETEHLWKQPTPSGDPGNATGEWVLANETDEAEVYFNDGVILKKDFVQAALWSRAKKGDRSAATPGDTQGYQWMNVDCKANLNSIFYQPDKSVAGDWLNPVPGRPGGAAMQVKRRFCK
jgi:hypothetical protein